ncbi:MAG: hypothetical protein ACPH12_08185 [Flavobacteriaceae bacterium]
MKHFIKFLLLLLSFNTLAQAPQGFNYQATVRNQEGQLITNQNVYFKFNLMQGSPTSVPVFTETHYVPTDDKGTVNLIIGQGTVANGTANFNEINWSLGNYHMGIELNTGNGYIALGTLQLMSVPYALYAEQTGAVPETPSLASVLDKNNSANNLQIKNLGDPTDDQDAVNKAYVTQLESQINTLQESLNTVNEALTLSGQINPDILWDTFISDSTHTIIASDFIQDADGNYVVLGWSDTDTKSMDFLISKLDSQGATIWSRNYGSNGSDRAISMIQKPNLTGYILCGYVTEASGDVNTGKGGIDIWVVEINNNGELVNEATFGGSSNDEPMQIINSSNGYAIIGKTLSVDGDVSFNHSGESDIWVLEISADLVLLNEKTFGTENNDEATSILESEPGVFVLNGLHTNLSRNWVAKIAWPSGEILWENDLGHRNRLIGKLKKHSDFIYLVTNSKPSEITNNSEWGYIAKLSQAGVLVDDFYFGGENLSFGPHFMDLAFDSSDNLYITGIITENGGDVTAPTFSTNGNTQNEVLVLKTDSNFNEIWQKSFGGSGNDSLYHLGLSPDIILDANNNPIFLTSTNSIDKNVKSFNDDYKIWLVKVKND